MPTTRHPGATRGRFLFALAASGVLVVAASSCAPKTAEVKCETQATCGAGGSSCVDGICVACPVCDEGSVCVQATCVEVFCEDRPCAKGQGCFNNTCTSDVCIGVSCSASERCVGGTCYPTDCSATSCLAGEVCSGGRCTSESCIGVACAGDALCANGLCYPPTCGGQVCPEGSVCENGACLQTVCVGASCPQGTSCAAGLCIAKSCGEVTCPSGQVCSNGQCVDGSCIGVTCGGGQTCSGGLCLTDPCVVGSAPVSCGEGDAGCARTCGAQGTLGECVPPEGPVDTERDPRHCGACGLVCPSPLNAQATCTGAACGRGPCAQGFFDVDGPVTFGCEATCATGQLALPDGGSLGVAACPPQETGLVQSVFSSGGAYGGLVQTSAGFTHTAVLGEPTPPPLNGAVRQQSATDVHQPGFNAEQTR